MKKLFVELYCMFLGIVWGHEVVGEILRGNFDAGFNAVVVVFLIFALLKTAELVFSYKKNFELICDIATDNNNMAVKALDSLRLERSKHSVTLEELAKLQYKYQEVLRPKLEKEMKDRKTRKLKVK